MPDVSQPDMSQPDMSEPDMSQPDMSQPTPAGPGRLEHWLVTGANGQVGTDLQLVLAGRDVTAIDVAELDLTDADAVAGFVTDWAAERPGARYVLNTAAYTAVDKAESDEATAHAVNADAAGHLARACTAHGARLVHISTDYVFSGATDTAYAEDATPEPRTAYGRTKLAGEREVLAAAEDAYVVRTAGVYGAGGPNFVRSMARLERERETLTIVDDQHNTPTWARHLAEALVELARSGADPGVYHYSGAGQTTWCGLARAVFTELGADPDRVQAITTDQYPLPAPRPAYSVLGHRRWIEAGLTPPAPWRDALHQAFAEVGDALRS